MATPGRPLNQQDRNALARLHAIGKPIAQIAKEVRVSRPTVYKYLKKPKD